jgi:phytanoyl-CoA hydroxylase
VVQRELEMRDIPMGIVSEIYQQYGYALVPGILSKKECASVLLASESFPTSKDGTFAPAMQPHKTEESVMSIMRHPQIVLLMEQICGGTVSGLQSVFYFGKPGTPGFTKHQDNAFVEAPPDAFASVWIALQDVTPNMGGLIGYPGSHMEPILPIVKVDRPKSVSQDPNANAEELVLPDGYNPIQHYVPRGAALFMHSHYVHESNANVSDLFRSALVLTYIRKGEPFRPGNTAKREEVWVY